MSPPALEMLDQALMRSSEGEWSRLYDEALPSTRTGPLYNAVSYPTKISPESIALFIATHTSPGDTVLDVFAGSGTTGIAAKLCDRPTPRMEGAATDLGLEPRWGPRDAVLYELGAFGSLIARVVCDPPDPDRFVEAAATLLDKAVDSHGWLYESQDQDGARGVLRYTIWSDVLSCPACGSETSYWDAAVGFDPLRLEDGYGCHGCGSQNKIAECPRVTDVAPDPMLGRDITQKRRVPAFVYGESPGRKWSREPLETDILLPQRAASQPVHSGAPVVPIEWGELYRAGYHTGISHLHHFYTRRNFLAVSVLWSLISDAEADLRDALRLLVLSFNAAHSTLMTRVVVKRDQKDFSVTGAQSGVLYVSGLPVEKNVFSGVRRKAETLGKAFVLTHGSRSRVSVVRDSSTQLAVPTHSVSYVFTDPPFGDYIPYSEVNQLNEAWLDDRTNREEEIVISPSTGKGLDEYEELMAQVFREVARVLVDDGLVTVVFHSAKAAVWQALARAYRQAGLSVRTTSVLDKAQPSFKQVVSTTKVKGDPLILLEKTPYEAPSSSQSAKAILQAVLSNAGLHGSSAERTRERMFSRFVTQCLLEDVPVSLDAAAFYEHLSLTDTSE